MADSTARWTGLSSLEKADRTSFVIARRATGPVLPVAGCPPELPEELNRHARPLSAALAAGS
jgi:hypothetical protein